MSTETASHHILGLHDKSSFCLNHFSNCLHSNLPMKNKNKNQENKPKARKEKKFSANSKVLDGQSQ